ncbi:MAG: hypothetical protein K8I60_08580 [Anaerolineae bacterium]|nr:hypothetical protein [Anaerolineae bacterium]
MSQSQLERAFESLYADTSSRDELTDDEARVLLQWGEQQITQLAGQELDDEQFDAAFAHLRKLISRINRFTGRRSGMSEEDQQAALQNIAASMAGWNAQTLSAQAAPDLTPDRINTYLQHQATLDNIANIQALTALVAPVEAAPPEQTDPSTEFIPDDPSKTGDIPYDQA